VRRRPATVRRAHRVVRPEYQLQLRIRAITVNSESHGRRKTDQPTGDDMAGKNRARPITRRRVLKGALAGAALSAGGWAAPAISQGATRVKMTLPWLPQGSQLWAFVARERGFWKKRGLDVEISRGFGSTAALQTLVQGQTDVGLIALPTLVLSAAQGTALRVSSIVGYDAALGILTLEEGPIKSLKDLEGKRLGSTPASTEAPYVEPFLQRAGVEYSKVTRVALQGNVLDSSLINKQVDAISAVATSNLPSLLSQGLKLRFFPMSSQGINLYQLGYTTTADYATKNRSVVEAWVDGLNEGVKYYMLNFEESVDIFLNAVPEVRMSATGKSHTRYGAGLFLATLMAPELKENGIGWGDMKEVNSQTDLIMKFVAPPNSKRPDVSAIFTNEVAGRQKLTAQEYERARKISEEFARHLSFKV
jgi:ABC-type nitrate/sulfonate/bicarbonate transport system substrate-binding protein